MLPRLLCAIGVAILIGFACNRELAAGWFAAALGGEAVVIFIGRKFAGGVDPGIFLHCALAVAVFTVTGIWTVPAILLWTTGNPAFQVAASSVLAVQLFHASTFAYRERISIIICGVPPAIAMVALPVFFSNYPPFAHAMLILVSVGAVLYAGYVARVNFNMLQTLVATQRRLRDLTDLANAANIAKTNFLSNMSHELRTPLNAILGFSELLGNEQFAANRSEYAQIINESGQHLLTLVNDVLDLAKIEAGKLELEEKAVDLAAVMRVCLHMMQAKAQAAELRLVDDPADALPRVLGDERALRQITLNLMSNAIKFTPPGGSVRVFSRLDPNGEIAFGVADTGIGIPEADLPRVFETFGQGQHDAVHGEKGTGLGLPIVKGLAEAHGGRVVLESRAGKGTCVTVVLPASRAVAERRPVAATPMLARGATG